MSMNKTNRGRFEAGDGDLGPDDLSPLDARSTTELDYSVSLIFARKNFSRFCIGEKSDRRRSNGYWTKPLIDPFPTQWTALNCVPILAARV